MLMARVPCIAGIAAVSQDRKNEDEPQSLRSMQIRWDNGFKFATIFTGRPKLSVILPFHASSALTVAPMSPARPA
jgi:hypothetical protein